MYLRLMLPRRASLPSSTKEGDGSAASSSYGHHASSAEASCTAWWGALAGGAEPATTLASAATMADISRACLPRDSAGDAAVLASITTGSSGCRGCWRSSSAAADVAGGETPPAVLLPRVRHRGVAHERSIQ